MRERASERASERAREREREREHLGVKETELNYVFFGGGSSLTSYYIYMCVKRDIQHNPLIYS